MKRIHVIANPAAGQPQPLLHTINRVFRAACVDWDISVTHAAGDARRAAAQAAAHGIDVVAAYGGDGTVLEAAAGLLGTPAPLAILPGGTANVLATELNIPPRLEDAIRLACDGDAALRAVDMGRAEDRLFIQRIGVGLDAEKVRWATREMKQRFGRLAYSLGWIWAARECPISHYTLTLDGKQQECDGITCHVANSGSVGVHGLRMLRDISVSDGKLDVLVMRDTRLTSVMAIAQIAEGHPADPDAFHHWQVRSVTVTANPPQRVHADGELWPDTPLSVEVIPGAVRIVAPHDGAQ